MRTWLVGNPNAGKGRHQAELDAFLASHRDVETHWADDETRADAVIKQACEAGVDRLIAFGGDGTIHSTAASLIEHGRSCKHRPVMGILPGGSANDFARGIGLLDVETAARAIDAGRRASVDVIEARLSDGTSRLLINAASGGIGGEIHEAMSDELKAWWGRFSYARVAAAVAPTAQRYRATVRVDDQVLSAEATAVLVMNGPSVGGAVLVPVATPLDGLLDVAVLTATTVPEMLSVFGQFITGDPLASDHVHHARGRVVTVDAAPPMPFLADGEVLGDTPLRFTIRPGALEMIVPEPEPATDAA